MKSVIEQVKENMKNINRGPQIVKVKFDKRDMRQNSIIGNLVRKSNFMEGIDVATKRKYRSNTGTAIIFANERKKIKELLENF